MQITNNTPFPLQAVPATAPTSLATTFVLKATFVINNGHPCTVAEKQRDIIGDRTHMDDLGRGPLWSTDLAPFKPNTDLLIHGSFHSPHGVPVRKGTAAFRFGPLAKELLIHGPRYATRSSKQAPWQIGPTQPVTTVPLRWELSFGGLSDSRNPMGLGLDPVMMPDGTWWLALPQIEDPAHHLADLGQRPPPANFAPVPRTFSARIAKQGTRDRRWAVSRAPLPPLDFNPSYHNAAPEGQQAGNSPTCTEEIVLRNMHPKHAHLSVWLPGLRADVAVLRRRRSHVTAEAVPMRLDTVVLLPDEDQLVLLWRGLCPVDTEEGPEGLFWVMAEAVPALPPVIAPSTLPARLMALYQAEQYALAAQEKAQSDAAASRTAAAAAAAKGEAAAAAATMADIRKALGKVKLPPELEAVIATETDPETLSVHLERYVEATLTDLERRFPPRS